MDATRLTAGCRRSLPGAAIVSNLHRFDLLLCNDLRFNIGRHLEDKVVARHIHRLDESLVNHLTAEGGTDSGSSSDPSLLLNASELDALEGFIADLPLGKTGRWSPSPLRYRYWVDCAGEINRRITPDAADIWGKDSGEFERRLNAKGLRLEEGIAIVRAWLDELRRYKKAMADEDLLPWPIGQFPTPTSPALTAVVRTAAKQTADSQPALVTESPTQPRGEPKPRKGTGGRPRKWDDLWNLAQTLKKKTPGIADKAIVAEYNKRFGKPIHEKKRPRATVQVLRQVRYERTRRKRDSD